MDCQVIGPRVRAVENMVSRARSRTRNVDSAHCADCSIELWISFYFDGTDNHRTRDFPRRHSNVVGLFDSHEFDEDSGIRPFYYEGVGTEFEFEDRYVATTIDRGDEVGIRARAGYRESESSVRMGGGGGIDIRLEKAMFDFEMFVLRWKDRKRVDAINVAAFGFSRGAATARAFANWIAQHSKVREVGGQLEFDGVPLRFRFLGVFDTVESVGLRTQNRRSDLVKTSIPRHVEKCLHIVAAHELRLTFGLTALGATRYDTVVYPGAHSDIGGGYTPHDQGREPLLARHALLQMLDHARGAGLKMLSLPEMRQSIRWEETFSHSFLVPGRVASHLQAYMHTSRCAQVGLPRSSPHTWS